MLNIVSLSYASYMRINSLSATTVKNKSIPHEENLLFVRDAFFITLFKTLLSIYKIHELFTSRGSVESACKV